MLRFFVMELQAYQSCRSNEGWQVVRIPSETDPKMIYTVHVSPWRADESICECPGFMFHHGKCKHQQTAWDQVCRWTEKDVITLDLKAPRSPKEDWCPRCGGPIKYEVEMVYE